MEKAMYAAAAAEQNLFVGIRGGREVAQGRMGRKPIAGCC